MGDEDEDFSLNFAAAPPPRPVVARPTPAYSPPPPFLPAAPKAVVAAPGWTTPAPGGSGTRGTGSGIDTRTRVTAAERNPASNGAVAIAGFKRPRSDIAPAWTTSSAATATTTATAVEEGAVEHVDDRSAPRGSGGRTAIRTPAVYIPEWAAPKPSSEIARLPSAPSLPRAPQLIVEAADGDISAADSFEALGVDPRIVAKLTAPRTASSTSIPAPLKAKLGKTPVVQSATAGVVRGHIRDGFGLFRPTRVQRLMIPRAIAGKSLCVRSETGSGKTLAYLLPVAHRLVTRMNASAAGLTRSEGTSAIIMVPTRELGAQIFNVVSRLLQPFPNIIPGLITGGEKRKSEKARLRKGIHILVCTPGRLLDHLKTTESFNVSTLRTLVLDEADRLLDLGFGPQLDEVVTILRNKQRLNPAAASGDTDTTSPRKGWTTYVLSATLSPALKKLATDVLTPGEEMGLLDAALGGSEEDSEDEPDVVPQGPLLDGADARKDDDDSSSSSSSSSSSTSSGDDESDEEGSGTEDARPTTSTTSTSQAPAPVAAPLKSVFATANAIKAADTTEELFQAPATLSQSYMVVPLKWRLVTILATLLDIARRISHTKGDHSAAKVILFVSTTHSVDFHHSLLKALLPYLLGNKSKNRPNHDFEVLKLHGNLSQSERTGNLRAFAAAESGLLVATDVASRGLDLPAIDVIVQADAPSDTAEYVHRVGRTARRGEHGEAILLLQPHELPYTEVLLSAGLHINAVSSAPALAGLFHAMTPAALLVRHTSGFGAIGGGGEEEDKDSIAHLTKRSAAAAAASGALPGKLSHLEEAAVKVPVGNVARRAEMYAALWQGIAEEIVARTAPPPGAYTRQVPSSATASGGEKGEGEGEGGDGVPAVYFAELAREAFTSFVRAYATHEKKVRHIFHPRALHLGHAAKAFGLRETPTTVVSKGKASEEARATASEGKHKRGGSRSDKGGKDDSQSAAKRPKIVVNEYDA